MRGESRKDFCGLSGLTWLITNTVICKTIKLLQAQLEKKKKKYVPSCGFCRMLGKGFLLTTSLVICTGGALVYSVWRSGPKSKSYDPCAAL